MSSKWCTFLLKQEIVEDCWSKLKPIIPKLFEGIEVKPTLLHGDLWEGNIALHNSKPSLVIVLNVLYNDLIDKIRLVEKLFFIKFVLHDNYIFIS